MTMCRPQEFYECNSKRLRGKTFSFYDLVDHYMDDRGVLGYFDFWSGFNIPSTMLEKFFSLHNDLNVRETKLRNITNPYKDKLYYVVASQKNDIDTLKHELVHAHYFLNPVYKQEVNTIIKHMRPDLKSKLIIELSDLGYTKSVMSDEINAYMATSGLKYLKEEFDLKITGKDIKPFVDLAKTVLRD